MTQCKPKYEIGQLEIGKNKCYIKRILFNDGVNSSTPYNDYWRARLIDSSIQATFEYDVSFSSTLESASFRISQSYLEEIMTIHNWRTLKSLQKKAIKDKRKEELERNLYINTPVPGPIGHISYTESHKRKPFLTRRPGPSKSTHQRPPVYAPLDQ